MQSISLEQLKAKAFDLMNQRDSLNNQIRQITATIADAELYLKNNPPKTETPTETPVEHKE